MSKEHNYHDKTDVVPSKRGDFVALILSVFVALFIWAYVMSVETPTSELVFSGVHVDVNNTEKLNQSAGLSILSESGNINVSFTLRGKKTILSEIKAEDIRAYVDVGSIKEPGTYDLEIACMPISGATVVDISPKTVTIVVDSTGSRTLPVSVKFDDSTLPDGYSLGEYNMSVDTVQVSGAQADLDKIGGAVIVLKTGTLTRSATIMNEVPVLVDKNGNEFTSKYITFPKVYIDVYIPVYLTREISLKLDTVYGYYDETNTRITLNPSKITVKGDALMVESMPDTLTIGKIDEKAELNDFSMDINLGDYKDGVTVISEEKTVNVRIDHFASIRTEYFYPSDYLSFNNPYNLDYSISEDILGLTIALRCKTDRIGSVNSDNIELVVDLSGVDKDFSGVATLPVRVVFKNELLDKAYEIGQYVVPVTVNGQQV